MNEQQLRKIIDSYKDRIAKSIRDSLFQEIAQYIVENNKPEGKKKGVTFATPESSMAETKEREGIKTGVKPTTL